MFIDLLSTSNYVSYNVKIAQLFGLKTAVYLSELININDKASRKNKLFDGDFFKIDRKYITERTTLTIEEQTEIESNLNKVSILNISPSSNDLLKVDVNILASILSNGDFKIVQEIAEVVKEKPAEKKTKKQAVINNLKNIIKSLILAETPKGVEILGAYLDWVDGVYASPHGFLSKRAIEIFIDTINTYANGNTDIILELINIATSNGHRDATWSISTYEERLNKKPKVVASRPSEIILNKREVY